MMTTYRKQADLTAFHAFNKTDLIPDELTYDDELLLPAEP